MHGSTRRLWGRDRPRVTSDTVTQSRADVRDSFRQSLNEREVQRQTRPDFEGVTGTHHEHPHQDSESPSARSPELQSGPLVSVVIPTYYRNERLTSAIESVRSQRYDPVEILVVDDSGEGHARPIAQQYDLTYIAHDRRRGANRARTTGIEQASGTYVQLLDDDDRLHPEKISRQVTVLERKRDVGVVYCGYVSEDGFRMPNPDTRGPVLEEALQFGPQACTTSTMLLSAGVLTDILPLADRCGADDIGLVIELSLQTEFDVLDEAMVYKGADGSNRSTKPAVGRELLSIVEEYESLYDTHPPEVRRTALRKAYSTLGENTLYDTGWSLTAIAAFVRCLHYTEHRTIADVARPLAAVFGSPGFRLASSLYRYSKGKA